MKRLFSFFFMSLLSCAFLQGEAYVGNKAPDFYGQDILGNSCSLDQYKGKIVVLEWTNPECPYVKKQYSKITRDGVGNLQYLQKKYTGLGMVWIMIDSSAQGKEGYLSEEGWKAKLQELGSSPTNLLIDSSGEVALLYGVKRTPEMFIVGKDGTLLYKGAIDSIPGTSPEEIESPANICWLQNALENILQGRPVITPVTIPYGCSIKQ